jgi:hypothetical protein
MKEAVLASEELCCFNDEGMGRAKYRVIQEERSVFWAVTVSVIVRKKKAVYEHASECEWLPRQSCSNLQTELR